MRTLSERRQHARRLAAALSRGRYALVAVGVFLQVVGAGITLAEEAQRVSPLGLEQQRLVDRIQRIESDLDRLARELGEQDDPRADVVDRALAFAREKLIEASMRAAAGDLHVEAYAQVERELTRIVRDLTLLVQILDAQQDEFERMRQREEQLKAWLESLTQMGREEWQALQDSRNQGEENHLAELDRQIAEAKALLDQQVSLRKETQAASEAGAFDFSDLSTKQKQLRRNTQQLAESMMPEATPARSEIRPNPPGVDPLMAAAGEQRQAGRMLDDGAPSQGVQDQDEAIEQLQKAIAAMEAERARAAAVDAASMQANQEQIAQDVEDLSKQMREAEQVSGEAQPGLDQTGAAKELMDSASEQLGASAMSAAAEDQRDAHRQIEDALQQVQDRLRDLQKEKRDALRERIIEQLRNMLDLHLPLADITQTLDAMRKQGVWNAGHEASLKRVGAVEEQVRAQGQDVLTLMVEDGTGGIVADVLADLNGDLHTIVTRLSRGETGSDTRMRQAEVTQALEDLVAALGDDFMPPDEPTEGKPQDGQGPSTKKPPPPLFAKRAQLILMRMQQARLNQKVERLAGASGERPQSPDAQDEAQRHAKKQADITRMTRELVE